MRPLFLLTAVLPMLAGISRAQDSPEVSSTEQLRDSVREWIETMREVQKEENDWERDREVLEDQREALRTEVADLKEQIGRAKTEKEGADQESLDEVARRDALAAAKEVLATEVRELEEGMVARLPGFPQAMLDSEPRVAQMIVELKQNVALTGDDAKGGLPKRLNTVINLLGEAEKWQATVHLKNELRPGKDGNGVNMKVVYFGLGSAYGVNESGDQAIVGRPGSDGWVFEPRPELAPRITELVGVLTGDVDAKFVSLPIELP